jgi:hypothetical protein
VLTKSLNHLEALVYAAIENHTEGYMGLPITIESINSKIKNYQQEFYNENVEE